MKSRLLAILLLVATGSMVPAQQRVVNQFSTPDGLANNIVYRIYQDRNGEMWFGTDGGLSRYDGRKISNYGQRDGLSSEFIFNVAEMADSSFWVCAYKSGLHRRNNDSFERILPCGDRAAELLIGMEIDAQDRAWLADFSGVYLYEKGRDCYRWLWSSSTPDPIHFALHEGKAWAGDQEGLFLADARSDEPVFRKDTSFKHPVTAISGHTDRGLYLATPEGVFLRKNGFTTLVSPQINVSVLMADEAGGLWMGQNQQGLYLRPDGKLSHLDSLLQTSGGVGAVNDFFEDKEGNVWIATFGQGVLSVPAFDLISYDQGFSRPSPVTFLQTMPVGELYAANLHELVGIAGPSQPARAIRFPSCDRREQNPTATFFQFDEREILALCNSGTIFRGNAEIGFREIQPKLPNSSLIRHPVTGNIWSLFQNKLYEFDSETGVVIQEIPLGQNSVIRVLGMQFEGERLWLLGDRGAVGYEAGEWTTVKAESGLPGDRTNALLIHEGRRYWGTEEGLALQMGEKWQYWREEDGLPHNRVQALARDSAGHLWIGTSRGLACLTGTGDLINILPGADWVPHEVHSLAVDASGQLWLGHSSGLFCIPQPEKLLRRAPLTLQLELLANGRNHTENEPPPSLPRYYEQLRFNFHSIDLLNGAAIEYEYRLGPDEKWIRHSRDELDLPSLASGEYLFEARAIHPDGRQSPAVSRRFFIETPFRNSPAFYLMIGLGLALAVGWVIYLNQKRLRKREQARNALRLKMNELKHQALNASLNPHFSFNILQSLNGLIDRAEIGAASTMVGDLSRLMRLTLEHTQRSMVSLEEEIEYLRLYFSLEKARMGSRLEYHFELDEDVSADDWMLPPMTLQIFAENSIKHGIGPLPEGGKIEIKLEAAGPDGIRISILDNGVGISPDGKSASENRSLGLKIVLERLELVQSQYGFQFDVSILPAQPNGTLVQVVLNIPEGG